jgi:hypothetical protein
VNGMHAVTRHDCICGQCGARFAIESESGPSNICDECAGLLLAVVMGVPGAVLPPEYLFPLAQPVPDKCGNRKDLPKDERVHVKAYLGTDPRHTSDGGIEDLHIFVCTRCGADQQTRRPPAS